MNVGDMLLSLVSAQGSGTHNFVTSDVLNKDRHALRNLADAVHHLSILHGRHPGVIDHATARMAHPAAREWLISAVDGFAVERTYLTRLVVAAGPLPSTPGQAESESAVLGQRHALEMLAKSDRNGCAIGAAAVLILDWRAVRAVLDLAAHRLGFDAPKCILPDEVSTHSLINTVGESPAVERAIVFGAQQILNQHSGLWDLLLARQIARGEY